MGNPREKGTSKNYGRGYVFDEERFRNDTPLSSILSGTVSTDMRAHMTENQRARAAWYGANGDIERKHTTGVFLDKTPTKKGRDPVLCVYVDSHVRMSDFNANKEIYLARLHGVGLQVSGVKFRLSDARHMRKATGEKYEGIGKKHDSVALPGLSQEERGRIEDMTRDLPDGIRAKAERAIELSFRRELLENTKNRTNHQK